MWTWFMEHLSTILISLVLLGVVAAIVAQQIRNHRQGKTSCGGNCGSCAGCSGCATAQSRAH